MITNDTPPAITGTPRQGQTLTTNNGSWTTDADYLSYTYQWYRCDATGASCNPISGATSFQYLLTAADVGSRIKVEVTAHEETTPAPAGVVGVSWLRYGDGALPPSHITDYDNVIVSWAGAGAAGASAATRPLVYTSAISCKTHAGGAYYFGVSKEEVEANGWVLAAQGGGNMYNVQYGGTSVPLGDMGLAAYQNQWCANVEDILNDFGVDGMFVDDVLPYLGGISGKTSSKYPTNAAVQAAYASFSTAVYNHFNALGKYVMLNANGYIPGDGGSDTGSVQLAFWQQLTTHCYCAEVWQVRNDTGRRKSGAGFQNQWDNWQRLPRFTQSINKDFLAIVGTSNSGDADYSVCSHLLESNQGTTAWSPYPYNSYNRSSIWHSFNDTLLTLGDPTGAKFQVGNQWRRQFTGGLVFVDPVAGTCGIS